MPAQWKKVKGNGESGKDKETNTLWNTKKMRKRRRRKN